MPKFRLRSYEISPPGSYFYENPPPHYRRFGPEPMIEPLARQVMAFRKGNGYPRPTYPECLEDVDHYMATNVLKGNSVYTLPVAEGEAASFPLSANAPGLVPCKGCGAPVPT